MTFAVLPVKDPAQAKRRLAPLLTAGERAQLAWLLYRRTLGILLSVELLDKVVVVSSDPGVLDHARREGAAVIVEPAQHSHSHSADAALTQCAAMGAARVLLAPIDVPLLSVTDIEQVFIASGGNGEPEVVIVPSHGGAGTNALLETPPGAIPCRFGPGSFAAHRHEAAQRGIAIMVTAPPGLTFDLDEPNDLRIMLSNLNSGKIGEWLANISVRERMRRLPSADKTPE